MTLTDVAPETSHVFMLQISSLDWTDFFWPRWQARAAMDPLHSALSLSLSLSLIRSPGHFIQLSAGDSATPRWLSFGQIAPPPRVIRFGNLKPVAGLKLFVISRRRSFWPPRELAIGLQSRGQQLPKLAWRLRVTVTRSNPTGKFSKPDRLARLEFRDRRTVRTRVSGHSSSAY